MAQTSMARWLIRVRTKWLLHGVLYVPLLSVAVSCLRGVWIGLFDAGHYRAMFPGVIGILYPATLVASLGAAVTAIFIALRQRIAVMANPFVGLASILLLELSQAPRINQLVVLAAMAPTPSIHDRSTVRVNLHTADRGLEGRFTKPVNCV